MRSLLSLLAVTVCSSGFAQDPTVPSAKMLERLHREPTPIAAVPISPLVQERWPPPVLKLKAMVMTDRDHGTALVEVDGRRIRLRLARTLKEQGAAPESPPPTEVDSVVIQGSSYSVQSFSARSIVLTNHNQLLLVQ